MKARVQLALYNALLLVVSPALLLKKAVKFGRRGENHEWDLARWVAPRRISFSVERPDSEPALRVVLVALSWGEVGILHLLTQLLRADFPALQIVWAIRDKNTQRMAQSQFPEQQIVPMPFDFAIPVANWLQTVEPDILVVVEKFWWPNLVWGAKLQGSKVILVNGRSRGRDKARYKLLTHFQKWVLSAFDALLFESEVQVERVRAVLPLAAPVFATGNVKFGFEEPKRPKQVAGLEKWIVEGRSDATESLPLLIAGSTSPIDEEWAVSAWEQIRLQTPCVLLLAPRRIERAAEVATFLQARQHRVSRRTAPLNGASVLLLDTLGELAYVYRFGLAALVGGAVDGRGHNIIEPLQWGIPVAYGPMRGDFESVQRIAEANEIGFRLHGAQELADHWSRALQDAPWRAQVKDKAARVLQEQSEAPERIMKVLRPVIIEAGG